MDDPVLVGRSLLAPLFPAGAVGRLVRTRAPGGGIGAGPGEMIDFFQDPSSPGTHPQPLALPSRAGHDPGPTATGVFPRIP
ncbi:hypothetical protein [Streptomyces sp. NPDC026673]|uniref:hypothetical protein n=1 Tax=Streptomyces sp. NPDC026673 TaxID=3155724 RepID=UPI0033CAC7A9